MINELMTHLWQSTLFAVAAGLLTTAFRKNRAKVRFGLWLSASLKFFIPFALLLNLGSHLEWTPAAHRIATQIATPAVSFAVEYVAQPFSVAPSAPAPSGSVNWVPVAMIALWCCGFIAIAIIRLGLWVRIRAAMRVSTPLEIQAAVGVRSAPGLLEPGVVGLLNPVLLLPEGILERLTPSQLEAVLAHELCHVRRRDNLFAAIHMLVEAIFWFHPLVWWIGARLVEERERACDEDVLSLGNQPRIYADAILNVCKLYVESPMACVSGVTGANIRRRIEAIMTNRRGQTLNSAKKILLATAGFAALAGPVLIGIVIGIGHVPMIHAQAPATTPQSQAEPPAPLLAQAAPPAAPGTSTNPAPVNYYQGHRLVAMLFDFSSMTSDEQAQARASGINFVQNDLKPADVVCVMLAGNGPLTVMQDFTADPSVLQAAIQRLSAVATGSAFDVETKLATIATAAKMLGVFPEKKALMYFSSGITQTGDANLEQFQAAINAAKQAGMAIYPIDARGTGLSAVVAPTSSASGPIGGILAGAPATSGGGRGPGRGPSASVQPEGVSQDEYNRRLDYAQANFGSTKSMVARSYIRYGAPDQIDTPRSNTRIWRYNYLDDFHGGAAFEFTGNSPLAGRVIYPPAMATYGSKAADPAEFAPLADALAREAQSSGKTISTNVLPGLPGGHVSVQINAVSPGMPPSADRKFAAFSVPLDSLSGQIDIVGQVRANLSTGAPGQIAGNLRDSAQASTGSYQATFTLQPGSYVLKVLVREQSTGRMFGELVSFDVP